MTDPDTQGAICKTISVIAPSHTPAPLEDEVRVSIAFPPHLALTSIPHAGRLARIPPVAHRAIAAVILDARRRRRLPRAPRRRRRQQQQQQRHHRPQHPAPAVRYLAYRPGMPLGFAQAAALADVLCAELAARGAPSTPFILSALALDV
ncbi:hypothetical protein FB107DRAFT_280655 [Schizophyllum commune]